MRKSIPILLFTSMSVVHGQVHLTGDLHLTGDDTARHVDALAPAIEGSAAVTVEAAVLGGANWAQAIQSADTLMLTLAPPGSTLNDGTVLRFVTPANVVRPLFIRVDPLPTLPVVRADGLAPIPGQLMAQGVAEVIFTTNTYVLVGSVGVHCPPGTLPFNDRSCIGVSQVGGLNFYEASERCASRGGKLCTWDEYYAGCAVLGNALTGLFDDWEWIDGTSNHTQTADQVGRNTCMSQRAAQPLSTASTRCCYHLR